MVEHLMPLTGWAVPPAGWREFWTPRRVFGVALLRDPMLLTSERRSELNKVFMLPFKYEADPKPNPNRLYGDWRPKFRIPVEGDIDLDDPVGARMVMTAYHSRVGHLSCVGDCEDIAEARRWLLRKLGWNEGAMRIVCGWTEEGQYHAVLAVDIRTTGGNFIGTNILDNRLVRIVGWENNLWSLNDGSPARVAMWDKAEIPGRWAWAQVR